jgi:hypothetical protein
MVEAGKAHTDLRYLSQLTSHSARVTADVTVIKAGQIMHFCPCTREKASETMLSAKLILTVLAFVAVSSAAPSPEAKPAPVGNLVPVSRLTIYAQLVSATITVCTGSLSPPQGCLDIPVVSDACINFIGGLTFFNKEVSSAKVPGGFVCTFFE